MKFLLVSLLLIANAVLADQDEDFLAARDAYRFGDAQRLASLSLRLKDTPLEVYITYYQLRLNLDTADIKSIREFLTRPEDTPLIDRLRGEWLKSLGKKQQWDLFDSEFPHLNNVDSELACYALQSRMNARDPTVLQEAHDLWFSAKDMPDSCKIPFDAAISAGVITGQDVWQRLIMALEAGNVPLAKSLAAMLSGSRSISPFALDRAVDNPARYLKKARFRTEGQRMVALFALQRMSRQSPDIAMEHWDKIKLHFPEDEQHYFFGWLAYEAARKHDPRALQWYEDAAGAQLNDQQKAWRVRAALRVMDWKKVLSGIAEMSPDQQNDATWQYWKGRALKAMGRASEALRVFVPLSTKHTFYGQLAAEEFLDFPVISVAEPAYQPTKEDIADIEKLAGVQRAVLLYRMEMRTDAMREWNWATRSFDDRKLLAAAKVARRNGMYDRAISTADKTVQLHDFSLRYLAPYRDVMRTHIQENGLEEAWVYGLMRQESRFVTSAKSGVGAQGLMQVMPTTARWIARKLGLKDYRASLLKQLDTNLMLGTYYMKNMLSQLDDNPVLASAAYNAGPGRARRWLADKPLEGAIYIETIPFDETRDYVKKVMSNTMYYAQEFGAPRRTLKMRLGIVPAGQGGTIDQTIGGP